MKSETTDQQNLKNIINKFALMKADVLMSMFGRKNHESKDVKIVPGMRLIAMITMSIFDGAINQLVEISVNAITGAVFSIFNRDIPNKNSKTALEVISKVPGGLAKSVTASFNYVTTSTAFEAVGLHKMLLYALYNLVSVLITLFGVGGNLLTSTAGVLSGSDALKLSAVLGLAMTTMRIMTKKLIQEGKLQEAFMIDTFGMAFVVLLINLNKKTK